VPKPWVGVSTGACICGVDVGRCGRMDVDTVRRGVGVA
jgi:hypothetical protein